MHTSVSAVQFAGQRATWPADAVYVGMAGPASRGFGIPDAEALFGKPWAFRDDPRGWPAAYSDYVAARLLSDPEWAQQVYDLHGKTLLCYCAAKQQQRGVEVACHARILAEYVELMFHSRKGRPEVEPPEPDGCEACGGIGHHAIDHEALLEEDSASFIEG